MFTATNTTALANSTVLTPAQYEHSKTRQQKAEDLVYTLNHSIMCLLFTDTIGLSGAANLYNYIFKPSKKVNLDHDHNTGYGAWEWLRDRVQGKHKDEGYVAAKHAAEDDRIAHEIEHAAEHEAADLAKGKKPTIHPDPAIKLTPDSRGATVARKFWLTSKKWIFAEAVGDLGAVPFTLYLQRHAPNFMHSLRAPLESAVGWAYKSSSEKSARNWGAKNGLAPDSQEVKDRQHELYEYEMSHMPQMAVWTVSSIALNFGAMHAFHKLDPRKYERTSLGEFAKVKGLGALFTMAMVMGLRGATPGGAHWWDQHVGKNIIIPVTKKVGGLFGVEEKDVDAFQKSHARMASGSHHLDASAASPFAEATSETASPRLTVQGGSKSADEAMRVERLQPIEQTQSV